MTTTSTIIGGNAFCSDCNKYEELRPYGKNGAWVCFKCAMKDEENAKAKFGKILNADVTVIDATLNSED